LGLSRKNAMALFTPQGYLGIFSATGPLITCGFRDSIIIRTRPAPIRHPGSVGTYASRPCEAFSGYSLNPDDYRALRIHMHQCILAAFFYLVFIANAPIHEWFPHFWSATESGQKKAAAYYMRQPVFRENY